MSGAKVRVAVNGYGVIGKRVADAVAAQDDMVLVGVADVAADYRMRVAVERGYPVYAAASERRAGMEAAGIPVAGGLAELLGQAAVVVDCTPKGVAAKNRELYQRLGVKAIWQGGEKHETAGYSFVAQVNYAGAVGRESARVVSCNTTGLSRVLSALDKVGIVRRARAVLFRRATDPWESDHGGMVNTVVPETRVPSHQGPDVRTVLPDLNVTTVAASGPFNLSHIHFLMVEKAREVTREEVVAALAAAPRVAFVRADDGVAGLNSTIELMRDLGRPRADMWEVAVWEDAIAVDEHDVYLTLQVHNEAIVVPETVDCIRALTGIERDGAASIRKTDAALGVRRSFRPDAAPPIASPAASPNGAGPAPTGGPAGATRVR